MAWSTGTLKPANVNHIFYIEDSSVALADTDTTYSDVIVVMRPTANLSGGDRRVYGFFFTVSGALTGTNITINLYGSLGRETTDTKYKLAVGVIPDITTTTELGPVFIDLGQTPMPWYWLGFTTDGDESALTMSVKIMGPPETP